MENIKKPIRSFSDLNVYQSRYESSIVVLSKIIPKLPKEEQLDLIQQLRRFS